MFTIILNKRGNAIEGTSDALYLATMSRGRFVEMTFAIFLLITTLYVALLLWCLAPPFRKHELHRQDWLRFGVGCILLLANIIAPISWPISSAIAAVDPHTGERSTAVVLFLRTAPRYFINVVRNSYSTATVIDVVIPIDVAGERYTPVVRTACTTRSAIGIDKGSVHAFSELPTISGGKLTAQAGNVVIAFRLPDSFCSMALHDRLRVGVFPDYPQRLGFPPTVFAIRRDTDNATIYRLNWEFGTLTVDDIVLSPLQITNIITQPARSVVASSDLWPVVGRRNPAPEIVSAYGALGRGTRECVQYVTARFDRRAGVAKTSGFQPRHWLLQNSQRELSCAHVLSRIPAPEEKLVPSSGDVIRPPAH